MFKTIVYEKIFFLKYNGAVEREEDAIISKPFQFRKRSNHEMQIYCSDTMFIRIILC